jgi:hypothetical protein
MPYDFFDLLLGWWIDLHREQFTRDANRGMVFGFHMDVRSAHVDGKL